MDNIIFYLLIKLSILLEVYSIDASYFQFIPQFFNQKNVNLGVFYMCWSSEDILRISEILAHNDVYTMFWTPQMYNNNYFEDPVEQDIFYHSIAQIVDVSCFRMNAMLEMIGNHKSRYFNNNKFELVYKWLLIDSEKRGNESTSNVRIILRNIKIRYDSDITLAVLNTGSIILYDAYNTGYDVNGMLVIKSIGLWNNCSLTYFENDSPYHKRRNMLATKLRIGTVITHEVNIPPEQYLQLYDSNNWDTINKFSFELFLIIKEMHNFSMNLTIADKWFGGGSLYGGVDDGVAKLLYENKVDMAATSGLLKPERVRHIEFIMPVYPHRTAFVFRNPGIYIGLHNEFLTPFTDTTWCAIFVVSVVICLVMKLAYWIEFFLRGTKDEDSWVAATLVTIAVFCQQGTSIVPVYTAGRLALLTLLVFSILLYNYYTSSIVSSLLSSPPVTYTTISELARSKLEVGLEDIVYVNTLFEVTNDSDLKFLYSEKICPPGHSEPNYLMQKEGVAKIQEGGFAYHTEPFNIYQYIEKLFTPSQICELSEIDLFKLTTLATMGPKRAQYKEYFLTSYRRLAEVGIISRQRIKWLPRKPICLSSADLKPIGIEQSATAFILLTLAYVVSLLILLIEIMYNKYHYAFKRLFRNRPYTFTN